MYVVTLLVVFSFLLLGHKQSLGEAVKRQQESELRDKEGDTLTLVERMAKVSVMVKAL